MGGPIFFQYITSHIFKQLIKQHFPVPVPVNNPEKNVETLTEDEKRAIYRYSSGYIPRNLLPKLKRSAHSNKENLRMCLLEVIEEDCAVVCMKNLKIGLHW